MNSAPGEKLARICELLFLCPDSGPHNTSLFSSTASCCLREIKGNHPQRCFWLYDI
jgi:hypothetical protein